MLSELRVHNASLLGSSASRADAIMKQLGFHDAQFVDNPIKGEAANKFQANMRAGMQFYFTGVIGCE